MSLPPHVRAEVEIDDPDYGHCVSVNDGWAVPEVIGVTIHLEEPELPRFVSLVVSNEGGTPECRRMEIGGGIDRAVTGTMIRKIPVQALVREATVHSTFRFTFSEEEANHATYIGRAVVDGKQAWIIDEENPWQRIIQHRAQIKSESYRTGRGIPLTDEMLQDIGDLHRNLKKEGHPAPIKEIMNRYGISRPTAQRWMRKARERGWAEHSNKSRPKI